MDRYHQVRCAAVFSGKLTYSASWDTAGSVSFWSQLDYQGIDCYVPLTDKPNPTLQDLVNGWLTPATQATNPDAYAVIGSNSPIQYLENLAAIIGKPLLFTELGYANDTGAAADPSASGNSPDPALQANLYKAFFEAWAQSGSSSLVGTYFWEWDPNGSTSNVGPAVDSFSPQNDPAEFAAAAGFETVMSGQTLTVSSGQTSDGIVVQSGGILDVVSGGSTVSATIFSGGNEWVSSGGTVSSTTISGGGLIVSTGGSAVSTTIDGGSAWVLSGGTANGAVISGGTLELYSGGATGSGPIVFAGPGATLRIDGTTMPTNVISGLAPSDTIDLAGVGFGAGGMAGLAAGNVLQVVAGGQTYGLQLDPSANFAGDSVRLSSDGHGGTDVSLNRGFSINVTYDSSVTSAGNAAAIEGAVAAAVQFYESVFTNPMTLNIDVGFGEINGSPISATDVAMSKTNRISTTYAAITQRRHLGRSAISADQVAAAAGLPPAIRPAAVHLSSPVPKRRRWACWLARTTWHHRRLRPGSAARPHSSPIRTTAQSPASMTPSGRSSMKSPR